MTIYSMHPSAAINMPTAWRLAERYLEISGRAPYRIIRLGDDDLAELIRINPNAHHNHWLASALKVVSYLTIILPVVALIVRGCYRSHWDTSFARDMADLNWRAQQRQRALYAGGTPNIEELEQAFARVAQMYGPAHTPAPRVPAAPVKPTEYDTWHAQLITLRDQLTACVFPHHDEPVTVLERQEELCHRLQERLLQAVNAEVTALEDPQQYAEPSPEWANTWKRVASELVKLHNDYTTTEAKSALLAERLPGLSEITEGPVSFVGMTDAVRLPCDHVISEHTATHLQEGYSGERTCPVGRKTFQLRDISPEQVMRDVANILSSDVVNEPTTQDDDSATEEMTEEESNQVPAS